jgi:hypothetical protein
VGVVCYQEEVSATGSSLVQRSPTECGVSKCDREASIMRRPWPTRGCCTMEKNSNIRRMKLDSQIRELGYIFRYQLRMTIAVECLANPLFIWKFLETDFSPETKYSDSRFSRFSITPPLGKFLGYSVLAKNTS